MVDYKARRRRKKIAGRIIKLICFGFLIAVVLFTIFQLYRAYDKNIITEPALEQTVNDVVNVDGFAVRNERLITYSGNGKLSYNIENAQRVEKDGIIAYAYADEDSVLLRRKIDDIQDKITQLEQVEQTEGSDPSALDKQIDEKLIKMLSLIDSGSMEGIRQTSNQLLLFMNKRQVVTKENGLEVISDRMTELKKEMQELSASLDDDINTIQSDGAGYFSLDVDGCEQLVDYSSVQNIKPEQFEMLPDIIEEEIPQNVVGKLVEDYRWFLLFEIPIERISQFKTGMNIKVKFPDTDAEEITMKLDSINSSDSANKGTAVGVLFGTNISDELLSLRRETAQLILNSYKGLRVSTRAIHYNDKNEMGVFTVVGNVATFKRIYPIYTSDNFVICGEPPKDEDNKDGDNQKQAEETEYLKKYDEVIVEGKDLADGKVVKG